MNGMPLTIWIDAEVVTRTKPMNSPTSSNARYFFAASLGAVAGVVFTLAVTKAIPKMMSQMAAGMMGQMMAQMQETGCSPADM